MKNLIIIIIIIFLFSCEEEIKWDFSNDETSKIVVDAHLTNETKAHTIYLTESFNSIKDSIKIATGATVFISDDQFFYFLNEIPANSGKYLTSQNFAAINGKKYKLHITYKNKEYIAENYNIPVTPPDTLAFKKNKNELYEIDWSIVSLKSDEAAIWEYIFDYSNTDYCNKNYCFKKAYYYTIPTVDVSQIFAPIKEEIEFPKGTLIIRRKHSINTEHAEFIRSLLQETEWRGGLFDVQQGNLLTNISNNALGYFAVTSVWEDTLRVQ